MACAKIYFKSTERSLHVAKLTLRGQKCLDMYPNGLTQVCDENGLLQGDVRQGEAVLGRLGFVGFAGEFVFLQLQALEVRGDVRLPVARSSEELVAVRTLERAHALRVII